MPDPWAGLTRVGVISAWRASIADLLGTGAPGSTPWSRRG